MTHYCESCLFWNSKQPENIHSALLLFIDSYQDFFSALSRYSFPIIAQLFLQLSINFMFIFLDIVAGIFQLQQCNIGLSVTGSRVGCVIIYFIS